MNTSMMNTSMMKNQTPFSNQKVNIQKNLPAGPVAVAKIKWKQQ